MQASTRLAVATEADTTRLISVYRFKEATAVGKLRRIDVAAGENRPRPSSCGSASENVCKIEDCNEPTHQKSRRGIANDLCKKHRGKAYKIRYKKRSEKLASQLEDCQEIFSGSPDSLGNQSLSDFMQHILIRKRVELMKSPGLRDTLQLFQLARQAPHNRRSTCQAADTTHEEATDKLSEQFDKAMTTPRLIKPLAQSEVTDDSGAANTWQCMTSNRKRSYAVEALPSGMQIDKPISNTLGVDGDTPNVTKSAFYQTKAGGPNALIAVRCGTTTTTAPKINLR